ncbi:Protein O-mannosyltransferase 2, variant 2 [Orbilia oligospora]|uniref:Dolichyl-phosphate-mannose--protein mannosyltransferase n=1 Tax=Orbilia oligospora TaxID=2813651 RepID=A0A6G1MEN2_ORBOL|nr:Protein O-mannosyltransferase 2 [Orbilia oligospora]KAF3162062.1 Protein O-mannosyltransferase 2, variant 2 [Orbilia oligospora]KAF3200554.1 Protein O-mannosyltransferase 2 [Orbilia oligospora]KAF3216640.1 Protein O-mannosyltransferase 2 [Orbilia oligospora]KAF3216641.1 Protein O-mannosyltransferase 2, variant 2 [Orbilia oligospora]
MATTGYAGQVDGELKKRGPGESQVPLVPTIPDTDAKKKQQAGKPAKSFIDEYEHIFVCLLFTAVSIFTRLWKIGLSNIVTWDEAHFGKFGSHYLKREFYFDVHPPLGKMLVGLSGYMAGYNGSFEFKSGETYPEEVNYTFMRVFNAAFGALCVPVAFYTAKELKLSRYATWLVTLMVLCENSYTTISRFILLDSMLLFFTFTTMLCYARLTALRNREFTGQWWLWLILSGLSIGCVSSVKLVGLFVTALVGLYTAEDLWNKLADTKMPITTYAAHWVSRIFGLIILPFCVYMLSFKIHFIILENSGPGDAQMSSLFQANLKGTDFNDSPLEVAIGSRATLKNMGYGGGLLHSHVQTYPEGSQQQQITCYHHKDANNDWFIYPNRSEKDYEVGEDLRFIKNNDVIRLIHAQTGRNLHSHTIAAPVTKADYEVSCYGNTTVGDEKDHWRIEVVRDAASRDYSKIRTLTTSFRLKHPVLNCYLRAGNVNLPQWGFKQIETTCVKENNPRDQYTHWNIESHWNEKLPPAKKDAFKSPFWNDFVHLNVAMMTSNNALVPDPDKQDDLASQPWQWPILHVGLRMCGWDNHIVKYFLLGNPAVYWGAFASLFVLGVMILTYLVRFQRGFPDLTQEQIDHIKLAGLYPAIGWVLHFIPFVIMARVTYVHHYYPALYFGILVFGFCFDWLTNLLPTNARLASFGVAYTIVTGLYIYFIPICFGMVGDAADYAYLKWFDRWRIYG